MPEFCARCSHDRRDHFDDAACDVSVLVKFTPSWWRRSSRLLYWGLCPCSEYIPEEEPWT